MKKSFFSSWSSLFSLSDEQAMWRVQTQDDAEAFAHLVERWEDPIQRLCTRMLGDTHRAEDMAQEAFTRLFARRKAYEPKARFSTFIWRIALNLCHDELRRRQRRGETFLDDSTNGSASLLETLASPAPAPDAMLAAEESAEMVRQALLRLPEAFRAVVVLRHYEDLKFREIAAVLDIPEGTVKSRMAEALSLLNQHVTRQTQERAKSCQTLPKRTNQVRILAL